MMAERASSPLELDEKLRITPFSGAPIHRAGLDTHGDSELAFLEDPYSRNAYSKRYFDSWDRPSRSNPLNH